MKLITVIIIGVFTITSAIRVPTSWPKKQNVQYSKFRTIQPKGSEIAFQSRPYVVQMQKYNNKINTRRKYQPYNNNIRHLNLKNPQINNDFKASATTNDWTPIIPPHMIPGDRIYFRGFRSPSEKDYRDDITPEPSNHEETEKKSVEQEVVSPHETPLDIPTRPIYPGEGQWAKRGNIHRPFISHHRFARLEEDEEKPEGYEVFEKNQKLFEKQSDKFREKIEESPSTEENKEISEDKAEEFVPIKLYAQVRRSESEQHLPRLVEEPRLREVVKDSKIQTVYTEEGYEDIAYDHAGHEKNAEENEGYSEFREEAEKEENKKRQKQEDSEAAGSQQEALLKSPALLKKNKFVKNQEAKTFSVKDPRNNSELEISSETKVLKTPNNGTKTHRYIKIYPKTYRYDKIDSTSKLSSSTNPNFSDMKSMESVAVKTLHRGKRYRRYTNDFTKIEVDTDFIDEIKHDLPQQIEKVSEKTKYPYYNDPSVNPTSAFRYAENLDNIPKKLGNDLAFYKQADKVKCSEVQDDVDPIPARIKNAENMKDATDIQELVKGPRLQNLGDKIDCFKLKYFGEDPLDNPLFKEDIGTVASFFDSPKTKAKREADTRTNEIEQEKKIKSLKQKESTKDTKLGENNVNKPEVNKSKESETLPKIEEEGIVSIITTPKYTIKLTPKHIYDQIHLLQYLPDTNEAEIVSSTEVPENRRSGKSMEEELTTTVTTVTEADTPESQALRKRRRRPRPRPKPRRPAYHIFDVNQFLPRSPYNYLNKNMKSSTVVPKQDVLSEAHYKDEIQPSEQLNVFSDVINNIKNSSKDPLQMAASSQKVSAKLNLFGPIPHFIYMKNLENIEETNSFYLTTTTTTTTKPPRGTVKFSSHLKDLKDYENLELLKLNKKLTTTSTEPYISDNKVASSNDKSEEENVEVMGLVPPEPNRYKTIYNPKLIKPSLPFELISETKMNNFYVLGMKPPPPKEKIYIYSDYKILPNKYKYLYRRRNKRSAQRPSYSKVERNRNKPIDVEDDTEVVIEDDDDYVPHRPKNYHYDVKTGRIVYDNVQKKEEEPDVEYVEVTEAPLPKPTRRNSNEVTTPRFENFTGPSFVDFVSKLRSDPEYQPITDPPSTEKSEEVVTMTSTTTSQPVSTNPPEFLNILAKVRNNSEYKPLEDKSTAKTTTTTEDPGEEQQETQIENVQNSPGGQSMGQSYQIFDISEYLPKVKSYSPRTSIDYSKYKTIERPNGRRNISSRYSSEQDPSEATKTSSIEEPKKKTAEDLEINPSESESKYEEVTPLVSATTEVPTTITTKRKRNRNKNRGSRRPSQRSTTTPTSSSISETEPPTIHHDKPKRTYPRRPRTRIKVNRTTESEVAQEDTTKILRRRHQAETDIQDVLQDKGKESLEKESTITTTTPKITTTTPIITTTTPIITTTTTTKQVESIEIKESEAKPDLPDVLQDRMDTIPSEKEPITTTVKPKQAEPRKIEQVQVFQKYDEATKHGGNYQKEEESKNFQEVKKVTDIIPQTSMYYTDAKLPKKINQLKEIEIGEEIEVEAEEEKVPDYDYEGVEDKTTTTKKPFFVKDPNKRLYYYAPL